MKTYPDLAATVKSEDADRRRLTEPKIGTHRIDIELVEQLRFRASSRQFSFTIDEPSERGGTEAGPPALSYFLAGATSCILTQYAKLAVTNEVPLRWMKAIARGHFDRRAGGAFSDITYEVAIESPADEVAIRAIARDAESMCYANNTLKKIVRIHTNLTLDGRSPEF